MAETPRVTYRAFAERYAGMVFDGTERSPLWDRLVPDRELELAAEGRRMGFRVIDGAAEETPE